MNNTHIQSNDSFLRENTIADNNKMSEFHRYLNIFMTVRAKLDKPKNNRQLWYPYRSINFVGSNQFKKNKQTILKLVNRFETYILAFIAHTCVQNETKSSICNIRQDNQFSYRKSCLQPKFSMKNTSQKSN